MVKSIEIEQEGEGVTIETTETESKNEENSTNMSKKQKKKGKKLISPVLIRISICPSIFNHVEDFLNTFGQIEIV